MKSGSDLPFIRVGQTFLSGIGIYQQLSSFLCVYHGDVV